MFQTIFQVCILHVPASQDDTNPWGLKEVYAVNVNIGTLLKVLRGHSEWWECLESRSQRCKATLLKDLRCLAWQNWPLKKTMQKNQKSIYQKMSNHENHGLKLQFGATTILWEDVSVQSFTRSREGGALLKHQLSGVQRFNQPRVTP